MKIFLALAWKHNNWFSCRDLSWMLLYFLLLLTILNLSKLMQAATQQLIIGYERLGLTLEQLANEHSISLTEVKMMLTQYSSLYRKTLASGEKPELDFSDEDLDTANQVLKSIMSNTDDEHLKFKAAKYIREDKKGRLDVNKQLQKIGVDLSTFNKHMQQMRERLAMKQANASSSTSNSSADKEQPIIEV